MANISEAYGAVTVTAPTADILATFICAKIRREQTAAYPTTVEPWFDVFIPVYRAFDKDVWFDIAKTYVKNNAVITEQGVSVVNQFFIADGRWRVYNNLKWFFSDVVTGGTPVIKEWVDVLQASALTATFNYTDITEDCIVVAKATVTRKDGITEIHDEEVYHEYERTEENLAQTTRIGIMNIVVSVLCNVPTRKMKSVLSCCKYQKSYSIDLHVNTVCHVNTVDYHISKQRLISKRFWKP